MPKNNKPKAAARSAAKPAPVAANHAADAVRAALEHKSDVEYVTKGELVKFAELIALIAVEKVIAAQSE